ncbi:hypothetical protein D6S17_25755 [Salmonella enterica subsp. enterica serovar Java]|uniref:Uncharacterized protein n=1 Tax=Salmonella enterica subsp. enterica serovar Java TaxID=224729 RepID=A0A5X0ZEX4_SALEB|nr:hypothetical protein [Salmonella enterica subsp. enterica serovar Java]ECA4661011.1 hypothetical protein [Salmonella enterica subsp. enterica serovar Cerro]
MQASAIFKRELTDLNTEYSVNRGSLPPRTPQAPRLPNAGSDYDRYSPDKTCRHTGTGERLFFPRCGN